ncbi:amidase [Agromyces sp. Soil535]|uniref:amidase n=1 Tax=Agromyces sp. Soil535 TaxID=1736390 RepID=UPI0009EC63F8|nr:amidase [Agromyces sp. Soil535]
MAQERPVSDTPIVSRTARSLTRDMATGALSAREVMDEHLVRIAEVNPLINAIVSLDEERARAGAAEADARREAGEPLGALHGLPIAIKDLMDTAGIRTTSGSRIYADHVPSRDALIVQRLKAAGAIVIGKTNTPEFGAGSHTFNEVFGATRNPYDLGRSAGGSSGGAGAALAAELLPIADGSDLGGSIRNPAAFNNVVGLRPSPGRVASARPGDAWDPASVLGPMARSVDDVALLLSVIAGPEPRAPLGIDQDGAAFASLQAGSIAGMPIAFSRTGDGLPVEDEVLEVMDRFRARLVALGARVTDVEPDLSGADEVFETYRALEFLTAHGGDARRHPELVKATVHQEMAWAAEITGADVARAGELRTRLFRRMQALFGEFELLVLPTAQLAPFPVDWEWPHEVAGTPMERYYTWQRSCIRITSTAMPALSLPAGFTRNGLPVGAQLVARYRAEGALLRAAASIEAASDVGRRRPVLGRSGAGG